MSLDLLYLVPDFRIARILPGNRSVEGLSKEKSIPFPEMSFPPVLSRSPICKEWPNGFQGIEWFPLLFGHEPIYENLNEISRPELIAWAMLRIFSPHKCGSNKMKTTRKQPRKLEELACEAIAKVKKYKKWHDGTNSTKPWKSRGHP